MLELMLTPLTFFALLIAAYTDLKTREIPDWLNYGLIFSALGIRAIFALSFGFPIVLSGLLGFAVFFMLAYLLYHSNQWGGGDSKLLMAMGAVIGIPYPFGQDSFLLLWFLLTMLFFGALYGLGWMIVLAIKKKDQVIPRWKAMLREHQKAQILLAIGSGLFLLLSVWHSFLWPLIIAPLGMFHLFLFVHTVEKSCFLKCTAPGKLTEGDWLAEDIIIHGQKTMEMKTLEKKDLHRLQQLGEEGKLKEVLIKEGIPFTPSFLAAYAIMVIRPEWLLDILKWILV